MNDADEIEPCAPCWVLAHWECETDDCPCALAGHSETLPVELFE